MTESELASGLEVVRDSSRCPHVAAESSQPPVHQSPLVYERPGQRPPGPAWSVDSPCDHGPRQFRLFVDAGRQRFQSPGKTPVPGQSLQSPKRALDLVSRQFLGRLGNHGLGRGLHRRPLAQPSQGQRSRLGSAGRYPCQLKRRRALLHPRPNLPDRVLDEVAEVDDKVVRVGVDVDKGHKLGTKANIV